MQRVVIALKRKLHIVFSDDAILISGKNITASAFYESYFETILVVDGNKLIGSQKQVSDLPQGKIFVYDRI